MGGKGRCWEKDPLTASSGKSGRTACPAPLFPSWWCCGSLWLFRNRRIRLRLTSHDTLGDIVTHQKAL
ncbi:MAG: hypothetical protein L6Q54_13565 [Leptospiraceae bacterium]|nr:hypothetical protein [Leptospiraceae bacterium]